MSLNRRSALLDLVRLFLRLGTVAFGGPAAHIAMFREEVVVRRKWLTEQRFLDLLGATNLIPGPNSTEMAIHIGLERAGWRGLIVAGACFILPASIIVGALAWAYVEFQTVPALGWITYGIKPVVVAIIFNALFGLGITAFKTRWLMALGLAGLVLFLAGVNELAVLFGGGFLVALIRTAGKWPWGGQGAAAAFVPLLGINAATKALAAVPGLEQIFLSFLKLGAVIYGSGYVLLPFMNNELVERLEWLTATQLLDAIAIGQITPGPVFTTATFVGYLLAGVPGAAVATVAIFLPSFAFVGALNSSRTEDSRPRLGRRISGRRECHRDCADGRRRYPAQILSHNRLADGDHRRSLARRSAHESERHVAHPGRGRLRCDRPIGIRLISDQCW